MQPLLLKYCRTFLGLTQKDLSELIGVHDSLISKIEAGAIPMQPDTERKLLEVFSEMGMDADSILRVKQMIEDIQKGEK